MFGKMSQRLICFLNNIKILQRRIPHTIRQLPGQKYYTQLITKSYRTPFIIMGLWTFSSTNDTKKSNINKKESLLAKADVMFDQGNYKSLYEILHEYKDSEDVEILWRLSRALYKMSQTASEIDAKNMIYEAYEIITTAFNLQENHFAVHKWMAILLDSKSNYEGMKETIRQSFNIKKHMLRAVELNPKDATTFYMLGTWCYKVSELTWYQRKIASLIFERPPVSTFEEAQMYFENAEKIDPKFYNQNLLMLGKTYLKLGLIENAQKYLEMTRDYPVKNDDDQEAKEEAIKLLASL